MSPFRGRRRHGVARKVSRTISIDVEALARLEALGNGVLSAGVAIAEHLTRDMPPVSIDQVRARSRPVALVKPKPAGHWIVFELVDGLADPLPEGEQLDAWRAT